VAVKVLFKIAQNRMHKLRRVFNCVQKIPKKNLKKFSKKMEILCEKNVFFFVNSKKIFERLFLRFLRFLAFSFRGLRELGLT